MLGDRRYRTHVSRETQNFIIEEGLGLPNDVVPAPEAAPYYPDSVRAFLFDESVPIARKKPYRVAIGVHAGHRASPQGPDRQWPKSHTLIECSCGERWAVSNAVLESLPGHSGDRDALYGMARSNAR